MGAAAAMIIIKRRELEVVQDFRDKGAVSPATAKSLEEIGYHDGWPVWPLARLRRRAVIREVSPGMFYLDEEVWTAMLNLRRRLAFMMVALTVLALIGWYLNAGHRGAPLT